MSNLDNQKITDCNKSTFKRKVYSVTRYKSGVVLGTISSTSSRKSPHRVSLIDGCWLVLGAVKP